MPTKKTGQSRGRPNKKPSSFGEKPNLTDTQWLALEREWRGCGEEYVKDGWPSRTPAEIVAQAAGVSRQTVHNWRTKPKYRHEYRRGLDWLLTEKLSQRLDRSDQTAEESISTNDSDPAEFEWVKYDPDLMDK